MGRLDKALSGFNRWYVDAVPDGPPLLQWVWWKEPAAALRAEFGPQMRYWIVGSAALCLAAVTIFHALGVSWSRAGWIPGFVALLMLRVVLEQFTGRRVGVSTWGVMICRGRRVRRVHMRDIERVYIRSHLGNQQLFIQTRRQVHRVYVEPSAQAAAIAAFEKCGVPVGGPD